MVECFQVNGDHTARRETDELKLLLQRHQDRGADIELRAAGVHDGDVGLLAFQRCANVVGQDRVPGKVERRLTGKP